MKIHLALKRKDARCPSSWQWFRQDQSSYGAINLGRYRIDFGWKR